MHYDNTHDYEKVLILFDGLNVILKIKFHFPCSYNACFSEALNGLLSIKRHKS